MSWYTSTRAQFFRAICEHPPTAENLDWTCEIIRDELNQSVKRFKRKFTTADIAAEIRKWYNLETNTTEESIDAIEDPVEGFVEPLTETPIAEKSRPEVIESEPEPTSENSDEKRIPRAKRRKVEIEKEAKAEDGTQREETSPSENGPDPEGQVVQEEETKLEDTAGQTPVDADGEDDSEEDGGRGRRASHAARLSITRKTLSPPAPAAKKNSRNGSTAKSSKNSNDKKPLPAKEKSPSPEPEPAPAAESRRNRARSSRAKPEVSSKANNSRRKAEEPETVEITNTKSRHPPRKATQSAPTGQEKKPAEKQSKSSRKNRKR